MPALAVIPGHSRLYRLSLYRPVTPEVAGSSPVAPIKIPANRHIALSVQTPEWSRLHRLFLGATRNGQKRLESPSADDDFRPSPNDVSPGREASCDYTK
jgi:hypothetical protein